MARLGKFLDRALRLVELVGAEPHQSVVDGIGQSRGTHDQSGRNEQPCTEAAEKGHRHVAQRGHRGGPATASAAVQTGSALSAALLRNGVVVAAFEGDPVGLQRLRLLEEVRPLVARHEIVGLPDDVELAVLLDLADQDRLGDVGGSEASRTRRP